MSDRSTVTTSRPAAGVALVALNRPDRLNAYTPAMCTELDELLHELEVDDDVRVVLLTGTGRGFCSGADLKSEEFSGLDGVLGRAKELRRDSHRVNLALHRFSKPIITLVNGAAVAGGMTMALLGDVRIAAPSARFGDTSGRYGLLPDEGLAWVLPRIVGLDRAARMLYGNSLVDAEEAFAIGLVSEVVPLDELVPRGIQIASEMTDRPAASLHATKWLLRQGLEQSFGQALDSAAFAVGGVNLEPETRERIRQFRETGRS